MQQPDTASGVLVCSVQRSGSTWFCSLLEKTGVAGRPKIEHFNLAVEAEAHRERAFNDIDDYVAYVRQQSMSPNGVTGLNVMWRQFPGMIKRLRLLETGDLTDRELLYEVFGITHYIFTYREDTLAQAISWARAFQTQQWTSHDVPLREPEYNFQHIDLFLQDAEAHNYAWKAWFGQQNIEPLYVKYEDLVEDPMAKIVEACTYLGATLPADFQPVTVMKPQRDELSELWRKQFLVDDAAAHVTLDRYMRV